MKRGPYKGREALYERARELRLAGWGCTRISKEVGIPARTIIAWVEDIHVDRWDAYRLAMRDRAAAATVFKTQHAMRKRVIELRGWKCEGCGLESWMGLPIPLELHHKSGRSNELENVELLCANCHALTPNYRNRNNNLDL